MLKIVFKKWLLKTKKTAIQILISYKMSHKLKRPQMPVIKPGLWSVLWKTFKILIRPWGTVGEYFPSIVFHSITFFSSVISIFANIVVKQLFRSIQCSQTYGELFRICIRIKVKKYISMNGMVWYIYIYIHVRPFVNIWRFSYMQHAYFFFYFSLY